jgi:hypothetical protein
MKNKILGGIAVLAIAAVAVMNVSLGSKSNDLSAVSLANVEALAQESGNTVDCPGGSCTYANSYGESCSACCPSEKNPQCNSFGCGCS